MWVAYVVCSFFQFQFHIDHWQDKLTQTFNKLYIPACNHHTTYLDRDVPIETETTPPSPLWHTNLLCFHTLNLLFFIFIGFRWCLVLGMILFHFVKHTWLRFLYPNHQNKWNTIPSWWTKENIELAIIRHIFSLLSLSFHNQHSIWIYIFIPYNSSLSHSLLQFFPIFNIYFIPLNLLYLT